MTSLPSGPLPIIPHFCKDSYSELFQSNHRYFLFMPSVKTECYPLMVDVKAFQFRLLKHFMNLVWVPTTAFLPMDKQVHKSQECDPMSASNESTLRLERALKQPEDLMSNHTLTQLLFVGYYFYKALYTLAGQGDHK